MDRGGDRGGVTIAPPSRWPRANYVAGAWQPAGHGARFAGASGAIEDAWPQSDAADLAEVRASARAAGDAWAARAPEERLDALHALARALEVEVDLRAHLAQRFGLVPEELAPHNRALAAELQPLAERPLAAAPGLAFIAPDWRELLRGPFVDLARELAGGRTVVLLSDARLPEIAERIALAAEAIGLAPGVLQVLHGARRELLAQAFAAREVGPPAQLVASGLAEHMAELRRIECPGDVRLRALRCGAYEVDAARALEASAAEVVEGAFGRAATLCGQLPGAFARVFCPARLFSGFTERLLAELAARASETPVPQIDAEAVARTRAAWELGLDEGATCIAGGDGDLASRALPPTVFTNVEVHMASARRQDPLPVLCLLRS